MSTGSSAFYPVRRLLYEFKWLFRSAAWLFRSGTKRHSGAVNRDLSIGVVTYVDRYDRFFKKLIVKLVALFPDTEMIVAINGYHDQMIQNDYLVQIRALLSAWPNVKVIDFHHPQSLSKLWNQIVLHASAEKVLILNDDIRVSPGFRKNLYASGALDREIALLNRSWSHFIISKKTISQVGWFDQRFPGVGNEDEDYECRLVLEGIRIGSYKVKSLKNIAFKTVNFSYGKDTEVVNTKYVRENKVYFDRKWDVRVDPAEGYEYVEIIHSYVKLKKGMETPDFYAVKEL
jgi:hypothetical protein